VTISPASQPAMAPTSSQTTIDSMPIRCTP
jgi:hypothetical protein